MCLSIRKSGYPNRGHSHEPSRYRASDACARVLALLLVCLLSAQRGVAQENEFEQPRGEYSFTWESQNETYNALPLSFDRLYRTLAGIVRSGGAIPTETWHLDKQLVPFHKFNRAVLLRARDLYDGKYYPDGLDDLFCVINPKICTGEKRIWTIKAGDAVLLPEISLEAYTELQEYKKRKGDRIANIVVRDRRGCKVWDAACEKTIKNLNSYKPNVLKNEFAGKILVPTLAYRAQIQITNFGADSNVLEPNPGLPESSRYGTLDSLSPYIVPEAKIGVQGVSKTCPEEHSRGTPKRVMKLIDYHPDSIHHNHLNKVGIGVLDLKVFVSHCRFHEGIQFVRAPDSGITSSRRNGAVVKWVKDTSTQALAACGKFARTSTIEHGTHIVGIVDAFQGALFKKGAGRNYEIMAYQKPKISKLSEISDINRTIGNMQKEQGFHVVNLSIGERVKGGAAGLSPEIERLAPHMRVLFVAAAGNLLSNETSHHVNRGETCDVWPACLGTKNIISVVAVDLDAASPKPTVQSNTGTAFDIAAPGQSMVSSIDGHKLGCMNGTSQATAIVSGAAALLFASNQAVRPGHVKNRLIYSSDILPSLKGLVFGGRLNVNRALSLETDQIERSNGPKLSGIITQWPDTDRPFARIDDGRRSLASWQSIRRLRRLEDGVYQVFYLEDVSNDKSQLLSEKVSFMKRKYLDEVLSIRIKRQGNAKSVTVPLKNIVDYTGRARLPSET